MTRGPHRVRITSPIDAQSFVPASSAHGGSGEVMHWNLPFMQVQKSGTNCPWQSKVPVVAGHAFSIDVVHEPPFCTRAGGGQAAPHVGLGASQ